MKRVSLLLTAVLFVGCASSDLDRETAQKLLTGSDKFKSALRYTYVLSFTDEFKQPLITWGLLRMRSQTEVEVTAAGTEAGIFNQGSGFGIAIPLASPEIQQIDGVAMSDGKTEARVNFAYSLVPTTLGRRVLSSKIDLAQLGAPSVAKRLEEALAHKQSRVAFFRKYDDGWRLEDLDGL